MLTKIVAKYSYGKVGVEAATLQDAIEYIEGNVCDCYHEARVTDTRTHNHKPNHSIVYYRMVRVG